MENYYKILNLSENCSNKEILEAYKFQISRFQNLPFLTNQMKEDIKKLKICLYILNDPKKRKVYDKIINKNNKVYESTKICDRIFNLI